jgi:flagellar hook-associated protein 1 FlgK
MAHDIYGIGLSALISYQQALSTTANNVTNLETPGYSREISQFASKPSVLVGGQSFGTGVQISATTRMYDELLATQVRNSNALYGQFNSLATYASQLDSFLWGGNPSDSASSASIMTAMDSFFASLQKVIQVPDSSPARQSMLTQGKTLAAFVNNAAEEIGLQVSMAQNQIMSSVDTINTLAQNIALLNEQISLNLQSAPNGLLDQRDNLIDQLSALVQIHTLPQANGTIDISLDQGTPLVLGNTSLALVAGTDPKNPANVAVFTQVGSIKQQIDDNNLGGTISGLFTFQNEAVSQAMNMLGCMVIGFSTCFNEQHQLGVDTNGRLGGLFFNDLTKGAAITNQNNRGTSTGDYTISDVTQLTYSDYQVTFEGGWVVTRLSDNTKTGPFYTNTFTVPGDGLTLSFSSGAQVGDSFLIQPTFNAASQMQVVINDPALIALGTPIILNQSASNTGTATLVDQGVVTNVSGPNFTTIPGSLTPPILIQFTSLTTYDILDNTNPASPVLIMTGLSFIPAQSNAMIPASLNYGYQITIGGVPNINDQFMVTYNTDGGGDSRNAQLLANLQNARLLQNGSSNFQDVFDGMVGVVGNITATALAQEQAYETILQNNQFNLSALSGVNMDEEASNLLLYQQGYQAAAQIISVATTLFQTIMSALQG